MLSHASIIVVEVIDLNCIYIKLKMNMTLELVPNASLALLLMALIV